MKPSIASALYGKNVPSPTLTMSARTEQTAGRSNHAGSSDRVVIDAATRGATVRLPSERA